MKKTIISLIIMTIIMTANSKEFSKTFYMCSSFNGIYFITNPYGEGTYQAKTSNTIECGGYVGGYQRCYFEFDLSMIPKYSSIVNSEFYISTKGGSESIVKINKLANSTISDFYTMDSLKKNFSVLNGTTIKAIKMYGSNQYILSSVEMLNDYVTMNKGKKIGFGVVNSNEIQKSLFISSDTSKLKLIIKYDIQLPNSPTSITTSNITYNSCVLNWNENSGRTIGYKIYNDNNLISTTQNKSYVLNNLNPSTEYKIKIVAYNEAGETSSSNEVSFTTKIAPPKPPLNFKLSSLPKPNSVNLTWSASNSYIDGYNLYKDNELILKTPSLSAVINNLNISTTYSFYVSCYNESGESDKIKFIVTTSNLNPPSNLTVRYFNPGPGYVLTWTSNNSINTKYKIYNKIPFSSLVGTSTGTSFLLGAQTSFLPNTAYVYTVSAYIDDCCESNESITSGFGYSSSNIKSTTKFTTDLDVEKVDITVSPNPVTDFVNIQGIDQFDIEVISYTGKRVIAYKNCTNKLDLSSLTNGIYFIKITTKSNQYTHKITKTK